MDKDAGPAGDRQFEGAAPGATRVRRALLSVSD